MNSIDPVQSEKASIRHQSQIIHRGRVRTGCLVCRARKVKCDEQRPSCQRCAKSKRKCVYKRALPPLPLKPVPPNPDYRAHRNSAPEGPSILPRQTRGEKHLSHGHVHSPECTSNTAGFRTSNIPEDTINAGVSSYNQHEAGSTHQSVNPSNADSPSARFYSTSLQIYVTTALDWLGACGTPSQPFSYFVEEVDSPILAPFDCLNWKRIKLHVTQLAIQDESMAAAIQAVQSVYRAQVNRLPMFHATADCQAVLATFEFMVASDTSDFDAILAMLWLLCLCEVILPNEDGPFFRGFSQAFEERLTGWLLNSNRSPISLRICAWLQFLHVATKRSGSCGLMSETVFSLLNNHIREVPNMSSLDTHPESASAMYDIVSAPIFAFYLELQRISNQIQDLSHYRRSRITPADQEEVTDIVNNLRSTLTTLWNARPSPLRFQPNQLRENFHPTIAEPLITLAGICTTAYYGEMVGLRRTLGDDPFPSPESEQPMRKIRETVDDEQWNVLNNGALNPGYIRPLFLYSIEHLRYDETQWAVARLKQVKCPISRSEFIATLGESLGRAQRTEKRRVATKYFCTGTFKVMVPRM